jgi:hypothetical protein
MLDSKVKFIVCNDNYPLVLDRFEELWAQNSLDSSSIEELKVLADLISAFEDRLFPLLNNPTYRDLLNERLEKSVSRI